MKKRTDNKPKQSYSDSDLRRRKQSLRKLCQETGQEAAAEALAEFEEVDEEALGAEMEEAARKNREMLANTSPIKIAAGCEPVPNTKRLTDSPVFQDMKRRLAAEEAPRPVPPRGVTRDADWDAYEEALRLSQVYYTAANYPGSIEHTAHVQEVDPLLEKIRAAGYTVNVKTGKVLFDSTIWLSPEEWVKRNSHIRLSYGEHRDV